MMLQALILILGVCLFAIVAYYDIRTRRIPNEFIVGILALSSVRIALAGNPIAGLYTLAASAALFIATFLLFWRGLLGGGDVKLIGATGLLVGYHDFFEFLVRHECVRRAGRGRHPRTRQARGARADAGLSGDQERPARLTVPYGAAIAAAGIVSLLLQNFRPG